MIIYIITLTSCALCAYFAQKSIDNKKSLFYFFSFFILVIPSLFAALRSEFCGIDVLVYCKTFFNKATLYSSFFDYTSAIDTDLAFAFILFCVNKLGGGLEHAFFFIEFFHILFFYIATLIIRKEVPIWLCLVCYMLGFYALSLNLMRQSIAISFLLIGYSYLIKNGNMKKYLIFFILSYFFHKTAIIAGSFFLYIHYSSLQIGNKKRLLTIVYVLGCVLILAIFKFLLSKLASLGGRFSSVEMYGGVGSDFKPTLTTILLLGDCLGLALAVVCQYMNLLNHRHCYMYGMICICSIMSELLGVYTGFAARIGMYFAATQAFYLPMLTWSTTINVKTRYIITLLVILAFLAIWLRLGASMGRTIPYRSDILGI